MKLNIACPTTGGQKSYDIDDDKKLRIFNDLRISEEVDATPLGDEFAGYVLRIMGGNDKQGFPMKQGVLTNGRVKLLLKPHSVGFRRGRHDGVRKRRTVRGCIVGNDLSVLNLVIVKKGKAEIPGLTDVVVQQRVGPKRASRIRKLFNLSKDDDVRKYAICKVRPSKKGGKEHKRMPHIQRLVTSRTLQHRRRIMAIKKKRWVNAAKERADYLQLLRTRTQEQRQRQHEMFHKRHEAQKLKKMMALRKAIAKRRDEKFRAKERRMAVIRRRTEANKAAGGRRKLTEEEIAEKIRKTRAARRTRWLKARAELRKKRFAALVRWRKEKKERRKLVKACDSLKSLTLKEKRRLINKRVDAELLAKKKNRYAIFSKKGAVKALGKAARPYGRKASLARKAAAKAAKAAKAASDPKKTQKQQKVISKEQPQKQQQQQQKQQQLPPPKEQKQQQQQPPKKVQQKKQQQQPPQTKKAKK